MLTVVGIGPGHSSLLTLAARDAIDQAAILVGGKRHLGLYARPGVEARVLDADLDGLMAWLAARQHQSVVILASGDPLLYGIGNRLVAHFGLRDVAVIPGISAIQYLCARAGIALNDTYITSSHGRAPDFDQLLAYPKVAMVTDSVIGPYQIAQAILCRGLRRTLVIGEALSSGEECIHRLAPEQVAQHYAMNVVVILNEG
ncbi:cobalt-precorrin-7 (C(5))-methyltransferase [Shimwellia pseudoproteus]|uniref:cobalt-precorrin-7 (C(5))-methyltransferase n=1 Tax=Shimwellia pseudoproteus TaxID=570012 RepID=UPI0018EB83EE|nr:cobalt-precorrin-7 (C(5))-methyltransferase [Shimwellia pseudoproteus]MBJ3814672.1 cobalt-precorrin-7 (C(5))-methyltransferase [Shimwellia pseudoproteus]